METTEKNMEHGEHFNESIVNEVILEDMKKNRIDHMKYLPGMGEKFSNCWIGKNICDICDKSMLFFCQISTKISRNSILTDSLNNGNFYLI